MLVLRRKPGEAIVLDGEMTVTVLAVEGEQVKLGISAPPDVSIVRGELLTDEEQERALRCKEAALERETDPAQRRRLEAAIARLHQSCVLVPASPEAR